MNRVTACLSWLLCIGILLFVGCKDDNDYQPGQGAWSLEVTGADADGSGKEAVIEMYGRYYSIYTAQKGEHDATLLLSTDAEWLTLMADTLPEDGILQLLAEENREARERTAEILVQSADNPERQAVITIRQRSEASYGDNDANPYADFRVGFGFSAFDEFKSPRSVRGQVIDITQLQRYDSDSTFHSTQEVLRGREDFTITSAWSLQEMSSKLTQEMVATTSFLGVKKTTRRFKDVAKRDVRDQACVYARLQKTVASRSIDDGVVRYLVNLPSEELPYGLPFTDEFLIIYNTILTTSGVEQESAIQTMLDNYGTHLVTEASVGCMMDMTLTFDKSESYDMETTAEATCRSIFGRSSGKGSISTDSHLTCYINNKSSIQIYGGSAATRDKLKNQIQHLTAASQLSPELVDAWLSSVSSSMVNDHRENLDIIDFQFIPIWELFKDPSISGRIQQQVIDMANRSDCSFTEAELSIDNYEIDLTNPSLTSFGTGSNASLVRLARIDDNNRTPLLEICQEYVPRIRSDRRINVFYPVFKGITRIGQGLFPGDGEGNPPSILTFSDGDVFVNPIEGYGYRDVIQKVYYIHGNLYTDSYEIGINRNHKLIVEDEYFNLRFTGSGNYGIVKIGSGYWTRQNIREKLYFGKPVNPSSTRYNYHEEVINGMLYANVYYGSYVPEQFENYFESRKDAYGHRPFWYLPTEEDILELHQYVGSNAKALFPNQQSGFEAQFAGYYGYYDDLNGGAPFKQGWEELRYTGQYCFIVAKDGQQSEALVLSPDYSISKTSVNLMHTNWYPIRAFRLSYFKNQ